MLLFFSRLVNLEPFDPFYTNLDLFHLGMSILVLPVFDVVRLFFTRLFNRRSPFRADNNHIHHLFVRNLNMSHRRSAVLIVSINLLLMNVLWMTVKFLPDMATIAYLLLFAMYLVAISIIKKYPLNQVAY